MFAPRMPMAHSIATIYVEELKATMRGRFAWLGAAVILLAVVTGGTRLAPDAIKS